MAWSPRLPWRARRRPAVSVLVLVVALVLGGGACGDSGGITSAAAEVNGETIATSTLERELDAMRDNEEYVTFLQGQGSSVLGPSPGTFDAGFVRLVLTRQIYLELVHQAFLDEGLELTGADRDRVRGEVANEVGGPDIFEQFSESYQATLVQRNAEVAKLQQQLSGAQIDEAAAREFYEQNRERFIETCARHILFAATGDTGALDNEATAAAIADLTAQAAATKARIAAGEDFGALATELSADPGSAAQGGDLGCGPSGQYVPEFEEALQNLEPGQISDPVTTQFGVHLISVVSRDAQAFEDVAQEIVQELQTAAGQGFGTFLREQLDSSEIEVNPRYGTFAKDGQSPGIRPPNVPTTLPVGAPTEGAGDDPGIPDFAPQG